MTAMQSPAAPTAARWRAIVTDPIFIAAAVAVAIVLVGQLVSPGFGAYSQVVGMVRVASFLGIMAIGQTIVILSGGDGIDLSVGKTATLGAIVAARIMDGSDSRLLLGILVPVLVGAVIGLVNGLGIAYLRIPPFVMTLGMTGVVAGIALAYTGGAAAGRSAPALTGLVNNRGLFDVPGVVYVWIVLIVAVTWLLRRSVAGWNIYAVGSNRVAANLSGVPVRRNVIMAYVASSVFACLGGILLLGYTESVFLNLADSYTLPTVAAVIIGGTLASGGVGGYLGTAIGALVLTFLTSLLSTMNMPESWRTITSGVVLLVLLGMYGRQRKLRT
ncbi:ABC transporter permease [Demequina soli]|uniref:ABC transporter permease n=1 Tax=Demequina soli TaxID=1638987 RepID=UPI0009E6088D|nr:ABC transporter permease [Demequina soli]